MPAFSSSLQCLPQCYVTEDKYTLLCRDLSFVQLFIEQKKLVHNEFFLLIFVYEKAIVFLGLGKYTVMWEA